MASLLVEKTQRTLLDIKLTSKWFGLPRTTLFMFKIVRKSISHFGRYFMNGVHRIMIVIHVAIASMNIKTCFSIAGLVVSRPMPYVLKTKDYV